MIIKVIEDLIVEKMKHPGPEPHFSQKSSADVNGYGQDIYEWGRRVRRDILVLEYHLKERCRVRDDELYGDPGDPPPPPE